MERYNAGKEKNKQTSKQTPNFKKYNHQGAIEYRGKDTSQPLRKCCIKASSLPHLCVCMCVS